MVRLVLAADGRLLAGPRRGRSPGRGASLHLAESCVRAALATDAFVRAFRGRRPSSDGRPWSVAEVLAALQLSQVGRDAGRDVAVPSPVSLSPQR